MATATKAPPYSAYAAITGVFAGGLGVAGTLARALGRNPACQTPLDLVVLSASVAIAVGWSPVGRYASEVLKAATFQA